MAAAWTGVIWGKERVVVRAQRREGCRAAFLSDFQGPAVAIEEGRGREMSFLRRFGRNR